MWRVAPLLVAAAGIPAIARADDTLILDALLDLRAVHADTEPSYVYGGVGPTRFDDDHDGLRLGRASLSARLRLTDTVGATAVIDAYGDGEPNPVGVSEAFVQWRPFPSSAWRWQVKGGAFFLPASLEHRLAGWTSPYTLSASALNTWLGEEFRVLGTEVEARWLGAATGYRGDVGVFVGVFGWNEGAGVVMAERGWALTDRPTLIFGRLARNSERLYYETDGRPGAYAGLSWRHHDRLEVRALGYDNRADPGASNGSGETAWRTRFVTVGARWEPLDWLALLAQHIDGSTAIGPNGSSEQFVMNYSSWYALASVERGRDRLSVRFDKFATEQLSGFYGPPPADETGHALTAAWMHRFDEHWELGAEWLRVVSDFPPRAAAGFAPAATDTQVQLAVRYRFRFETG
jgi:hypothetical protein